MKTVNKNVICYPSTVTLAQPESKLAFSKQQSCAALIALRVFVGTVDIRNGDTIYVRPPVQGQNSWDKNRVKFPGSTEELVIVAEAEIVAVEHANN